MTNELPDKKDNDLQQTTTATNIKSILDMQTSPATQVVFDIIPPKKPARINPKDRPRSQTSIAQGEYMNAITSPKHIKKKDPFKKTSITDCTPQQLKLLAIKEQEAKELAHFNQSVGDVTLQTVYDANMTAGARRLLDMTLAHMYDTNNIPEDGSLSYPLNKYMYLRGLSDKKEARKAIKEALLDLHCASVGGGNRKSPMINIIYKSEIKNSQICIKFPQEILQLLPKNSFPTPTNDGLWMVSDRAYKVIRAIISHSNKNRTKTNKNILSVHTLLEKSGIIRWEDVAKSDQSYISRIITPFEKILKEGADSFTWDYYLNGRILTAQETADITSMYKNPKLCIRIHWLELPKHRLDESQQAQQEQGTLM